MARISDYDRKKREEKEQARYDAENERIRIRNECQHEEASVIRWHFETGKPAEMACPVCGRINYFDENGNKE